MPGIRITVFSVAFLPIIAAFDARDMQRVVAIPFAASPLAYCGMFGIFFPCAGGGVIAPNSLR